MATAWVTAWVVISWYGSNIGVLILNKYLLSHTGFRSPVFLTLCHMLACVGIGLAVSMLRLFPVKPIVSRSQFAKVALLAAIFCMTIVMGNISLRYLPVSFNQAVGASTPFFTAFFSFFMQGTRESPYTYATLVPIAGGVILASGGEPLFHALGFAFCLGATAGRALKSVVQAIIMADPAEKMDAMSLLLYMSSISVVLLVPTAAYLEPQAVGQISELMEGSSTFIWWLLGNSSLAYFVNLTNFLVTKYTSALTLQVLGNAKGVVAAIVSIIIFRNPVTWKGILGYAVTVVGVILYSETKKMAKAKAAGDSKGSAAYYKEEKEPLLTSPKEPFSGPRYNDVPTVVVRKVG